MLQGCEHCPTRIPYLRLPAEACWKSTILGPVRPFSTSEIMYLLQIWLVRNPKCLPSRAANAEPLQDGHGAMPLQAAIVQGESLVAQLSRKSLRDAAALLAAV